MLFYEIKEILTLSDIERLKSEKMHYVAILSTSEFDKNKDYFDMGIDMDMDMISGHFIPTKVESNYDSLTGHFNIPSRNESDDSIYEFSFALDEKGIVFIDDNNTVINYIDKIRNTKKWRFPSLERFLYDFLEIIVIDDLRLLEGYNSEMDKMEDAILAGELNHIMERLVDIRSVILDLRPHYEQLIDLAMELEENENDFFDENNLRFFHLFKERAGRLQDILTSLREHSIQVKDLYQAQIDIKQNRTMTVLTVVVSIFTPLTFITGWFGMNFKHMPELEQEWAYPVVALVCLLTVICLTLIFKKKKLL